MSKSNKWIGLAVAAVALAGPALAGIEPLIAASESGETKTRPTKVESMARVADRTPTSSLRCYQEGRLVFESSGVEAAGDGGAASVFKGIGGRSIQLFDLKHGMCILDSSNG